MEIEDNYELIINIFFSAIFFNQLKFYFDGVINTLTPIKYISKIRDFFNERTDFNINQLNKNMKQIKKF